MRTTTAIVVLLAALFASVSYAQIFPRIEKEDVKKRIATGSAEPEAKDEPEPEDTPEDTDVDGDKDMDVLYSDHTNIVARDGKTGEETFRFDATVKGELWEDISSALLVADLDGDGLTEVFFVAGQGTSTDEFKNNYGRAFAVHLKGKGPEWTTFRSNLRRTGNPAHDK